MPDREKRPDIDAYGHSFRAHRDSEGREGYALFDDNPRSDPRTRWQEIAVIYPSDARLPVHSENNAALKLRDYGTNTWQERGSYSLDESLDRAAQHADRHYEKYGPADARFDEHILEQTLAERDPERREAAGTERTDFLGRVKANIRKAAARKDREKDKDRERD